MLKPYKCKLLEVVLLYKAHHKCNHAAAIEAEGDEPVVGQEGLQELLQEQSALIVKGEKEKK